VATERSHETAGLAGLRRSGTVTELLFLYECATLEPTQLRPIAERLGLTVQAASHAFRQLRRRGLVEVREGRYRPTVEGVAWLHETLRRVGDDLWERIDRLHVIRSTRAVALADIPAGGIVSLELRHGVLSARPGGGGSSRGRVGVAGRKGSIVDVSDLEGIVPLVPAPIAVRTITLEDLGDARLSERVRRTLPNDPSAVVAADGLEAYHTLLRSGAKSVVRFAPAAACLEASHVGVPSYILALESNVARLLAQFASSAPPTLEVAPIPGSARLRRDRH